MATGTHTQPSSRNGREQYRSPARPTDPGGFLWPQIRNGREADFSEAYEWDLFLNVLGRKNRRRGHALPLGEVACHYVTDVEMRHMILQKYPDVKDNRGKARKVYLEITNETNKYLRLIQTTHNKLLLECVYGAQANALGKTTVTGARPRLDGRWMATLLQLRPAGTTFRGYEGNKIGIDLSANTELYEERQEVLDYLRRDQQLDTRGVRTDWEPHASIFIVHSHLSVNRMVPEFPKPQEAETPSEIAFEAPKVLMDL